MAAQYKPAPESGTRSFEQAPDRASAQLDVNSTELFGSRPELEPGPIKDRSLRGNPNNDQVSDFGT